MTIASTPRRAGPFATNGVQTAFPFAFKVFAQEDLYVISSYDGVDTELVLGTNYTVTLNADQDASPGGTVTLLVAPDGPEINVLSGIEIEQPVVITNQGGFYPRVFNDVFDRLTIIAQQLAEKISRAPLLPLSSPTPGQYLVTAADGSFTYSSGTGVDAGLRTDLALAGGANLITFLQSGAGAVARTAASKLADIRTFEDFGAVGDVQSITGALNGSGGAATDDTAAVQAAIDWAFAGGVEQPRAIHMTAKGFLVGALTLYPTVTIVGTGRMTSFFVCKTGTTGKWISDRGNGGQKLMLSGFACYARDNPDLTHILEVGNDGVQFGTQGVIRDLWLRDAVNAYAYEIDANVGFIEGIVGEDCRHGGLIRGNANMCRGLYSMQAGQGTTGAIAGGPANIVGLELYGCHLDQAEIEAPTNGSLPLKIYGDTHITSLHLGMANGYTFSHLIEVDVTNYDTNWSVKNLQILNGSSFTITNGVYKVGATYRGGTSGNAASARDQVNQLNVYSGKLLLKYQQKTSFRMRVTNTGGTLQHRIGSPLDGTAAGSFTGSINDASATLTNTPTGADASTGFATGAKISSVYPSIIFFNVAAQITADADARAAIVFNNTGTDYGLLPQMVAININGVTINRLGIQLVNRTTGAAVNWATALGAAGNVIDINVDGFLA